MSGMEIQKEINTAIDTKEALKKGNIEEALSGIQAKTEKNIEQTDLDLKGQFEVAEFTSNLNEENTLNIKSILDSFLAPQKTTIA